MGDRNTEVALLETPNSLRALYGISVPQNGVMGSPDNQTAEIQIASLFASSPPFPTTELPPEDGRFDSLRSVTSSMLESIKRAAVEDEGYAPSSATNPSTMGGGSQGRLNVNGKVLFKARLIPATHDKPDIVPRTTRAAALRAGQPVEKTLNTPRAPVSKERLAQTFANVPGHKRSSTIAVASTAAPTIAPRMSRAASLRLGQAPPPPAIKKRASTNEEQTKHGPASTFEGVPGHKRRESIAVPSMKAPTVAPRLNKSAALRAQKEQAPPTSFMCKINPSTIIYTLIHYYCSFSQNCHNAENSISVSNDVELFVEPSKASRSASCFPSLCKCPTIKVCCRETRLFGDCSASPVQWHNYLYRTRIHLHRPSSQSC